MKTTGRRRFGWFVVFVVGGTLAFVGTASGTERHVPGEYPTIQQAIDACIDGDEVVIEPNTYTGDGNRDLDFGGRIITVRGTDPNDPNVVAATVIDCEGATGNLHRGFWLHSGEDPNALIAGLTIANGKVDSAGGGGTLCEENSGVTVSNCVLYRCRTSGAGGGILCTYGDLVVKGCRITRCSSSYGGGVYQAQGNLTVLNCGISDCYGGYMGGGILCYESQATIAGCTITDNECGDLGAGITCIETATTMSNCIIARNTVWEGGSTSAGGIVLDGPSSITNCTIADNEGYLYEAPSLAAWDDTVVANCILRSKGSDSEIYGIPIVTHSNVRGGWEGDGNIDADPGFVPLDDDYHLLTGSPCIDAGTNDPNSGLSATDIEGLARPADGDGDANAVADMGAHEKPAHTPIILTDRASIDLGGHVDGPKPYDQSFVIVNGGGGTLAWTIEEQCPWLEASPASGECVGDVDEVFLSFDATGLSIGDYTCSLAVVDANALNSPRTLTVTLHVREILRVPSEYETIQSAIDAADDYEMILIADGTHIATPAGSITVDKPVTLRSENGPEACIVDGRKAAEVMWLSADCVIDGLTIANGQGTKGGGIYSEECSPSIRNCIVTGNKAWIIGGGVYSASDTRMAIIGCSIVDNRSDLGGGAGGGPIRYVNCTIAGNIAEEEMGGIWAGSGSELTSCILWGNTAPVAPQLYVGKYCKLEVTYCDVQGGPNDVGGLWSGEIIWGEGSIDVDPCFVDADGPDDDPNTWQDNDYHLRPWSPCRNAGDPCAHVADQTDIDGEARSMGGRVDIGADECTYHVWICGEGPVVPLSMTLAVLGAFVLVRRRFS